MYAHTYYACFLLYAHKTHQRTTYLPAWCMSASNSSTSDCRKKSTFPMRRSLHAKMDTHTHTRARAYTCTQAQTHTNTRNHVYRAYAQKHSVQNHLETTFSVILTSQATTAYLSMLLSLENITKCSNCPELPARLSVKAWNPPLFPPRILCERRA